jgi:hypothetical protein
MATATLLNTPTTNGTVISTAESTASWTGTGVSLDNEIFIQGSNSVSSIIQAQANKSFLYFTTGSVNLTNTHLCMWWQNTAYGKLTATNAVQVLVGDGSNTSYFTVRQPVGGTEGLPEYAGGWTLLVVDMTRTPDQNSGTNANISAVTRVGVRINFTSSPRNVVNNWLDNIYYVPANTPVYDVYGGTSGDEISWVEIAAADAAQGWGLLQSDNGVFRLTGPIQIGDNTGTTATAFKSESQVVIAANGPVAASYYDIMFEGNGTNATTIFIDQGVVSSAENRYEFNTTAANVSSATVRGVSFSGGGQFFFKAGQTVTNNTFNNCLQIDPSTSTFSNNGISNYTEAVTNGALLWPGGITVTSCSFTNCDEGIEITQTTDQTFQDIRFDDVTGKFDVHLNNGGTSITVSNTDGGNANSFTATGGGTVTFVNAKTLTINNIEEGTELRIYSYTDVNDPTTYTEVVGAETVGASPVSSTFSSITTDPDNSGKYLAVYGYDAGAGDIPTILVAHNLDFKFFRVPLLLKSSENSNITVFQEPDNQYSIGTVP